MDLDTLFILAQFSDNYVRYSALGELRYRLIQVIIPPKEGLPGEYLHTEAMLRYNGAVECERVEAFLSPIGSGAIRPQVLSIATARSSFPARMMEHITSST